MTRKAVAKRRAQLIVHTQAELEQDRDRLRAATKDCYDESCTCHRDELLALSGVLFLLGEYAPEVPPRWTETET